jgi:hypothetical protein
MVAVNLGVNEIMGKAINTERKWKWMECIATKLSVYSKINETK